ncbi:MAG: MarR family winged helix-turn-helix transcriptional regulator [Sciscionella sp.]
MPIATDIDTATRLRAVVGRLSRRLRSTVAGAGLTPTQISVLASVVRRGPMKLATLGELEGLNPTMLSRSVGNLEKLDMVARRRDERDARTLWVHATATGKRTQQRIRAERSKALGEHLNRLSTVEHTALEAALPALEALADSLSTENS